MALPAEGDFELWLPCQEASGTRSDETSNGNDFSDNNTVTQGTGNVESNCADFTKAQSEFLSITNAAQTNLKLSGDFSCGMWVNFDSTGGIHSFFNTMNTGFRNGWEFKSKPGDNELIFTIGNASSASNVVNASTSITTGTWYFLVVTWDDSAKTAEIFLNASSVGSGTSTIEPTYTTNDVTISWSTPHNQYFDGQKEQIFIANKLLSSSEITSLYNSGSGTTWSDITGGGGGSDPVFIPKAIII